MLTCKVGDKKFTSFELEEKEFRKFSKKGIIKCPISDLPLVYKKGKIKIPHFAYKDKPEGDLGFWENETKEHYSGKYQLYKWLKKDKLIKKLELEKWIPETKQIADIYFEKFGKKYVIEYQCTPTTFERYLDRRFLYSTVGIEDIWIFGIENFNFGKFSINNGKKFKLKAMEQNEMNRYKSICHFDPFKRKIYKSFYHKSLPMIHKEKLSHKIDNLFFHNGQIIFPTDIEENWIDVKNQHKKNIIFKEEQEQLFRIWLEKFSLIGKGKSFIKTTKDKIYKIKEKQYQKLYLSVMKEKLNGQTVAFTSKSGFNVYPINLYKFIKNKYTAFQYVMDENGWNRMEKIEFSFAIQDLLEQIYKVVTKGDEVLMYLPKSIEDRRIIIESVKKELELFNITITEGVQT